MRKMRLFVTLLAILCLTNSVSYAQRNRHRRVEKKEKVSVDSLIKTYRFTEAVERLEEDIAFAEKRRRSTELFEAKLDHVHSLQVMMSATEKVKYIDSIVVDKEKFLSAFQLGADCGKLAAARTLLPDNMAKLKGLGDVAFRNELNDKIYFSIYKEHGLSGLHVTTKAGDTWGKARPLKGLAAPGAVQDFPYVLSDGVTMYYAEDNNEGLGGYDIYVTRYNPDTDSYLKASNIGMPFNSMANDYLYVIDEMNNLGWFATDRNQPADKVCIYIFLPNASHVGYNNVAEGEEAMRRYALIHSINDSRPDKNTLDKAKVRLQQVMTAPKSQNYDSQRVAYVINDDIVYHSLLEFKSKDAQRIAMEWAKENNQLKAYEQELYKLRKSYKRDYATREETAHLLKLENLVSNLRVRVSILAKNMRKAELK